MLFMSMGEIRPRGSYRPQKTRPPTLGDHRLGVDPSRVRLFDYEGRGVSFPTDGKVFTIGRNPESDLWFQEPSVSREHAYGCWQDGQLWIKDHSSRGTAIDGEALDDEWTAVPEGGKIRFGDPGTTLTMGVGGSHSMEVRLDQLVPAEADQLLRLPDGKVVEIPPQGGELTVGRHQNSQLRFDSSRTSGHHAKLRWHLGRLQVKDLNSTNGTLLDGKPISPDDWVTVPNGSKLQFGPSARSGVTVEPKAPLLVTFFGDGSVPDIGDEVKAQPRRFERAFSNANSPAMVRGMVAEGNPVKDIAMAAVPVVFGAGVGAGLVATGLGVAAMVAGSLVSGPALAIGGLAYAGFSGWGLKATKGLLKGGIKALKEKFSRSEVQPSNWQHVEHYRVGSGPAPKQFQQLWHQNLERFPTARHVVFVSGHGNQKGAAGLKFSELGKTVQGAEAIFLDSCNGAQLESLSQLSGSARVAVASAHTVQGYGFPLDDMFSRDRFPEQPRDLCAALVQAAHRSMPSESLVAVDLKVLKDDLLPSLDTLGKSLLRLKERGHARSIKSALKDSVVTQSGVLGFGKKIDLGSFLGNLARDPQLRHNTELVAARRAFDKTVLSAMGNGTLSFDLSPGKDMPPEWRSFLKKM